MKISYSELNTYQRCPAKYSYAYIEQWQKKKKNINLFNGINAHAMLQEFFLARRDGKNLNQAWGAVEAYTGKILKDSNKFAFENEKVDAKKEVQFMFSIVGRYVDQYAEEWEILHVEEEFYILLGDHTITFTPDLVVRKPDSSVWPVDHKTTSGKAESGIPFGDMQSLLYYSGVKQVYPETAGFIFNKLRKKIPSVPQLVKTGKKRVARLANIDTTYEVLRNFLLDEAPDLLSDLDHQKRLAELRDQPDQFFWQETVYVTDQTVESICRDIQGVIIQLEASNRARNFPRHLLESRGYKDCSSCEFKRICHSDMIGWDSDKVLEEDYETREAKNPYE